MATGELLQGPVYVYVDVDDTKASPVFKCYPDPVPAVDKYGVLEFQLMTPGWHFKEADPVVIIEPLPQTQFPLTSIRVSPSLAKIFNYNTDQMLYRCNLRLGRDGFSETFIHDPSIQNGM